MSSKKTLAVRKACTLPPADRTEDHISDVLDFVKDIKFFTKLNLTQQRALCRRMVVEEFGPKENVFQIGDMGDKFYIILSGGVGVQSAAPDADCPNGVHTCKNCTCPGRPLETVVFLERGMAFGELALQSDQPRSATILTSENTELLVMTRADYDKYAGQLHRQFLEQRVEFLRRCPRIEDALQRCVVTTQDIAAMANCLSECSFSGNEIVVRQGESVEHMIFVRSGQLAMVRAVDVDACRNARKGWDAGDRRAADGRGVLEHKKKNASESEDLSTLPDLAPRKHFMCNLAKAMMDLRRKEREKRLDALILKANGEEDADRGGMHEDARAKLDGWSWSRTGEDDATPKPANASASEAEKKPRIGRGKTAWAMLRLGVRQAGQLRAFVEAPAQKEKHEVDTMEDFVSVSKARRRQTAMRAKELAVKRRSFGNNSVFSNTIKAKSDVQPISTKTAPGQSSKRRLFRIGTISPHQYFGDDHVGGADTYPVSLISDPVADIYLMTKHDILRRIPKKLFSLLFQANQQNVPSDVQLLDMHRQTKRWDSFRSSLYNGVDGFRRRGDLNAAAKLEFLGVPPNCGSRTARVGDVEALRPRQMPPFLTPKDEEHFSQASAHFLRQFGSMRKDPELHQALGKEGLLWQRRINDCLADVDCGNGEYSAKDPTSFFFNLHWSKQEMPSLLDLCEEGLEDEVAQTKLLHDVGDCVDTAAAPTPAAKPRGVVLPQATTAQRSSDSAARRVSLVVSSGVAFRAVAKEKDAKQHSVGEDVAGGKAGSQ